MLDIYSHGFYNMCVFIGRERAASGFERQRGPGSEAWALFCLCLVERALSERYTLGASAALNPNSGGIWVVRGGFSTRYARARLGVLGRHSIYGGARTQRALLGWNTLKT